MTGPYSGTFEFDEGDEPSAPLLRPIQAPAAANLTRVQQPPPTTDTAALPAERTCQAAGAGLRQLLYIKSDRLAQLSAQLSVNSDRSNLVHGLISAYGLLEVRTEQLNTRHQPERERVFWSSVGLRTQPAASALHKTVESSGWSCPKPSAVRASLPCPDGLPMMEVGSSESRRQRPACQAQLESSGRPLQCSTVQRGLCSAWPTGCSKSLPMHASLRMCCCQPRQGAAVEEAAPASLSQLEDFHSREYLSALALHGQLSERQRAAYGLEDDCAPFPG